jgi:Tfp pilus assembly protein PilN
MAFIAALAFFGVILPRNELADLRAQSAALDAQLVRFSLSDSAVADTEFQVRYTNQALRDILNFRGISPPAYDILEIIEEVLPARTRIADFDMESGTVILRGITDDPSKVAGMITALNTYELIYAVDAEIVNIFYSETPQDRTVTFDMTLTLRGGLGGFYE